MKNTFILLSVLVVIGFTACTKEKPVTVTDNESEQTDELQNVNWFIANEDLPSADARNTYSYMELLIDDELNYTWTWHKKDGTKIQFKGDVYAEESQFKHSNGKPLWNISVNVVTVNGLNYAGNFYGLYTYEDHKLLLNVEPDVQNWGVHPTASEGIGSGKNEMESVYTFTKE